MIRVLLVLMMFCWAGCAQQEDSTIPRYDATYIDGLSDGSRPPKDSSEVTDGGD